MNKGGMEEDKALVLYRTDKIWSHFSSGEMITLVSYFCVLKAI